MDNLTAIVRKLTGRQLTNSQIDKAERSWYLKSNPKKIEYSVEDGEIVVRTTLSKHAVTKDPSNPHIFHEGYYPYYESVKAYTLKGLLKKKSVDTGHGEVFLDADCVTHKEIVYDPPGSFIGKY